MDPDVRLTIRRLLEKKKNGDQIVVGLAGGSGCGKTTISNTIVSQLGDMKIEQLCLDRFFLPVEKFPAYYSDYLGKEQPNFNHPEAMDFKGMIKYCRSISGFDLVFLEGHFALYRQEVRDLMDLKCFVSIETKQMLDRRIARNLEANYGGDRENIIHYNNECVLPMYINHILPMRNHADLFIPNSDSDTFERDVIIERICAEIVAVKSRMQV